MSNKWKELDDKLQRSFEFEDFQTAFMFMTRVAFIAEHQQHHPNWKNEFNKVEFNLSTHDSDNKVTEKDRKLAASIDEIYEKFFQN